MQPPICIFRFNFPRSSSQSKNRVGNVLCSLEMHHFGHSARLNLLFGFVGGLCCSLLFFVNSLIGSVAPVGANPKVATPFLTNPSNERERLAVEHPPALEGSQLDLPSQPDDDAFYREQVKPILEKNCFECHGANNQDIRGGLALTSRAAILNGGDSGPAVDLDAIAESVLLDAINYQTYEMPPDGKLPEDQIAILTEWVRRGVPIPADEQKELDMEAHRVPEVNEETKQWWSFQSPQRPSLPAVNDEQWSMSPLDRFILRPLEEIGLTPAAPATRGQLIRRAYYDLLGLPPTADEVEAFVNDPDPDAFSKLVDRLLQSPHYGEKWGRHWLDLVRYAESNSFERDGTKPFVWRYRDYVIQAFNEDKPYDQFLIEQLAGDEIENPSPDSLIATGYYRLGAWDDEPADPLLARYDELDDIIATTAQTMLGLTVNCARCHDHKIDPIPIDDYYRFAAFFENTHRYGIRSPESVEQFSVRILPGDPTDEELRRHQREMRRSVATIEEIETLVKPDFEPVEHEEFSYPANRNRLLRKRVGKLISEEQFREYERAVRRQQNLNDNPPGSYKILSIKEKGADPPQSFVRIRGNPHVSGNQVQPGFLSVLSPPEPEIQSPATEAQSSGRRLALARWIAGTDNPLTARVMVNRIWQYHFGRGLVRSTSDFGFQGTPPTHPELLDWLATEFIEHGWSIKQMHRIIMNSRSYQMSSQFNQAAYDLDPLNDRFWRFDMRRLTAEEIRDSILAVSGQLNLNQFFGPSVYPALPREVLAGQSMPGAGWGKSPPDQQNRRSVYVHIKRSLPVPILSINDAADTDTTCPVRFITNQPTQALTMLNSEFLHQQAQQFAAQILDQHDHPAAQVAAVLTRVTQRSVDQAEIDRGVALMEELIQQQSMSAHQALEIFCLLALNLNEFVYID